MNLYDLLRKSNQRTHVDAEIKTSQCASCFVVSITLFFASKRIAHSGLLLNTSECESEERAWLAGYNLAQRLADKHAPDAALYVVKPRVKKRNAA